MLTGCASWDNCKLWNVTLWDDSADVNCSDGVSVWFEATRLSMWQRKRCIQGKQGHIKYPSICESSPRSLTHFASASGKRPRRVFHLYITRRNRIKVSLSKCNLEKLTYQWYISLNYIKWSSLPINHLPWLLWDEALPELLTGKLDLGSQNCGRGQKNI